MRGDVHGLVRKHGVCLYIKDMIKYIEIEVDIQNLAAAHSVEFDLWVLSVYRPPSYSDQQNALLSRFVCEFSEGREVIVLGDFNLPSILDRRWWDAWW